MEAEGGVEAEAEGEGARKREGEGGRQRGQGRETRLCEQRPRGVRKCNL